MERIWTIQYGLVGTASVTRYGDLVDFKRAEIIFDDYCSGFPNVVFIDKLSRMKVCCSMQNAIINLDVSGNIRLS